MGQLCIFQQRARIVCSLVNWVWIILYTPVFQLMPNDCLFQPCVLKVLCSQELVGCIKYIMLLESKIHILFEQNTKEIKEDISIVKLKITNLHKAIILQDKFTETLKNRSSVYYSIKIVL